MNAVGIQKQLAERIAAIGRKHATIGTEARRHEGTKGCSPVIVSWEPFFDTGAISCSEAPGFQISNLKFEISHGVLPAGLGEIDQALSGGLPPGLHEWYGAKFEVQSSKFKERNGGTKARRHEELNENWQLEIGNRQFNRQFNRQSTIDNRQFESARRLRSGFGGAVPLCLLVHLAWRALEANPSKWVLWVGNNCFPYPAVLVREGGRDLRLLRRSLFVHAQSPADRVWVADLGLRCGLTGAVIADGTSLDMAATRRFQLSAKSRGAFVFLARPPQDLDRLSAAATRWMVRRSSTPLCPPLLRGEANPQWTLELLRCKGLQPSTSRNVWLVEWDRAANVIRIPAPVCNCINDEARRHGGTKARRESG